MVLIVPSIARSGICFGIPRTYFSNYEIQIGIPVFLNYLTSLPDSNISLDLTDNKRVAWNPYQEGALYQILLLIWYFIYLYIYILSTFRIPGCIEPISRWHSSLNVGIVFLLIFQTHFLNPCTNRNQILRLNLEYRMIDLKYSH